MGRKIVFRYPRGLCAGVVAAAEFVAHISALVVHPLILLDPPSPQGCLAVLLISLACIGWAAGCLSFSPQVDAILSELKSAASSTKRLHICLFSATLPPSVVLLAESIAYGAVHLSVGGYKLRGLQLSPYGETRRRGSNVCVKLQRHQGSFTLLLHVSLLLHFVLQCS